MSVQAATVILPHSIENPVLAKRLAPLLSHIRNLALRRGDGGLRSLSVALVQAARNSSGSTTTATSSSATTQVLRCGPDDVKSAFATEGILLTGPEMAELLQAFRDPVGYLLIAQLLDALVLDVLGGAGSPRLEAVRSSFRNLSGARNASSAATTAQIVADGHRVAGQTLLSLYQSDRDPRVIAGITTPARAANELIDALFPPNKNNSFSANVTEMEYIAYQAAVALQLEASVVDGAWLHALIGQWPSQSSSAANSTKATPRSVAPLSLPSKSVPAAAATSSGNTLFGGSRAFDASRSPRGQPVTEMERLRWAQTKERDTHDHNPHIVGYVGHLPTAVERFGETFQHTDIAITQGRKELTEKRAVEQHLRTTVGRGGAEDQVAATTEQGLTINPRCPPITRQGNKANSHSFRMS